MNNLPIIDILIVAVVGLGTWCVASEGAIGAGTILASVVLSGLLAMNFFEPLAELLGGLGAFVGDRSDMFALLGLFAALLTLFRIGAERLQPVFIPIQGLAYDVCRWGFGFLSAYVTAAILLTALHTAPLPREFLGFTPERKNLFGAMAPDLQWLGFTQYVTEKPFARSQVIPDPEVGDVVLPRPFDARTAYHWGLHKVRSQRVEEEAQKRNLTGGAVTDKDLAEAATRIVIPSFVVRYADRREMFGGGAVEVAPIPDGPSGPTPGGPQF